MDPRHVSRNMLQVEHPQQPHGQVWRQQGGGGMDPNRGSPWKNDMSSAHGYNDNYGNFQYYHNNNVDYPNNFPRGFAVLPPIYGSAQLPPTAVTFASTSGVYNGLVSSALHVGHAAAPPTMPVRFPQQFGKIYLPRTTVTHLIHESGAVDFHTQTVYPAVRAAPVTMVRSTAGALDAPVAPLLTTLQSAATTHAYPTTARAPAAKQVLGQAGDPQNDPFRTNSIKGPHELLDIIDSAPIASCEQLHAKMLALAAELIGHQNAIDKKRSDLREELNFFYDKEHGHNEELVLYKDAIVRMYEMVVKTTGATKMALELEVLTLMRNSKVVLGKSRAYGHNVDLTMRRLAALNTEEIDINKKYQFSLIAAVTEELKRVVKVVEGKNVQRAANYELREDLQRGEVVRKAQEKTDVDKLEMALFEATNKLQATSAVPGPTEGKTKGPMNDTVGVDGKAEVSSNIDKIQEPIEVEDEVPKARSKKTNWARKKRNGQTTPASVDTEGATTESGCSSRTTSGVGGLKKSGSEKATLPANKVVQHDRKSFADQEKDDMLGQSTQSTSVTTAGGELDVKDAIDKGHKDGDEYQMSSTGTDIGKDGEIARERKVSNTVTAAGDNGNAGPKDNGSGETGKTSRTRKGFEAGKGKGRGRGKGKV